ncbi:ATP-dependent RNA helicase DEAH12, chloroplastic-like [Homarus americanus]|uniref:ATP-dependent RNA helicase DEAH12, chloroplastic-like n=1 Tax=Homarus americanus TaxID=6706 RepID=UPI001C44EF62|nr:ATP-dependent RNA helicase DEAH12, chloroplastic-like [Homarus americanus]
MEFTLEGKAIEHSTGNTIVTLQCKSKRIAQSLKTELHKGNRISETKVWCFDTLMEATGLNMRRQDDIESLYENYVQQISKRAESALEEHYSKLFAVESRLQVLEKKKSKFISFADYVSLRSERDALEDKEKELNLQKDEFLKCHKNTLCELFEAKESINFEKCATDIRLKLAIECNRLKSAFPIYARRSDIVDTVKSNQVSVIIGETGSGKSTQIAPFLCQAGLAEGGMIACTQPRKIAATSLATHVAKELGTPIGQVVGYKVGMQTKKSNITKVLYLTDHVLLNECLQDRKLSAFSCIIIDEAHERSIYTDLLLGMIKECLQARPDLRLVITSATINPEIFVKYFKQCPVLSVSGRMFPVEVEWKEMMEDLAFNNYQEEALGKAIEVHESEEQGDILVFLTSPLETEKCCGRFQNLMRGRPVNYVTFQLHGRLQGDEQQKVFDPAPGGKRKIVFATNCAETSVTIPGIKYVIDTGLVKEMRFDPVSKMSTLAVTMVTQSSAKQRQGRAGRLGPGKCYRLYTEDDFNKMNPDTVPEILRVHIGHALLKLMELGVDPMEFDYIQSPSVAAMEEAHASLLHIGAVSGKKITELGKWIAKMPFDPKYGAFVYEAIQDGAGVEAIVVAAASGTSSVFYRAGTNEEKEKADKHKIRFCHEGGDQLTLLNVFREWHKVPEIQKGRWCARHYINGKSIKGIRETTNEVLHTIKNEMKKDIKFSFSEPETVDCLLIGLLLKSLKLNLSHYLGHAKAGYNIVGKEQRVEVHPSSSLFALGSHPEWIAFDQVMRTSRDFAMQVTPVSETLIMKGIADGWLQLQLEEAKKKRIIVVSRECVGRQLFREFVGPRYVDLRNFETDLVAKFPNSVVVVEADWDQGEVRVLSNERNKEDLSGRLPQILAPLKANFMAEESEERIGPKSMDVSVRAVVGAGGCMHNVFMPEEFRIVKIHCTRKILEELSKETVLQNFGQYGKILECKKYYHKIKSPTIWGQITFEKTESAVKAVRETKGEPDFCAHPSVRLPQHGIDGFRTKIHWCRRRSKGFGFVEFVNVEDCFAAQRQFNFHVGGLPVRIKCARNSRTGIHVAGLGQLVTEDVLRQAFAQTLGIDYEKDIQKVTVIREKVNLDEEMLRTFKRRLQRSIEEFAKPGTFHLEVKEPRSDRDVNFIAFCAFNNPEEGHRACTVINRDFCLNNEKVFMKADLYSSVFIRKDVFKKIGDEVTRQIQSMENVNREVRLKLRHLKSESVVVDLHSENVDSLSQTQEAIQKVIRGEVIDCENHQAARSLFTRDGRNMLQTIMNKTETLIVPDDRVMTVAIHGSPENKQIARIQIDAYLQQLSQGISKDVELKGNGKPSGVLKALILKYGLDLNGMQTEANLSAVSLDLRNHRLRVQGPEMAITKAVDMVNQMITNLAANSVVSQSQDDLDCVTCFCPIELEDLYRLECCGHSYCKECIKLQMDTAIAGKEFPIVCGEEKCTSKFVWRDFVNLSRQGHISMARLVAASLGTFVSQHKDEYHYCTTPDCPTVYRVTQEGVPFMCPECSTKICTKCHVQYHDGLSCTMYKSMKEDDGSLTLWLMQDKNNRKLCPNCSTAIEKIAGCNKMLCGGCKKCLCWVCMQIFNTEQECYGHLQRVHGSFH